MPGSPDSPITPSATKGLASRHDTAISAFPTSLASLRALVDPSHILYGSDYPFLPEAFIERQNRGIAGYPGFDAKDVLAVERESALALFPRLRA